MRKKAPKKPRKRRIRESERKRYLKVWSTCRDLNAPLGISNIATKILWERSLLPSHLLSRLWDLVDRGQKGWLDREEFILGLWSIDQMLWGRKLPVQFDRRIWASFGNALGVRIPRPKWEKRSTLRLFGPRPSRPESDTPSELVSEGELAESS
jgi:hypothetical protein